MCVAADRGLYYELVTILAKYVGMISEPEDSLSVRDCDRGRNETLQALRPVFIVEGVI